MTTIGRSAAPAAWAGDSGVLGAVIVALVPMGVLHVVGSTVVDPVAMTISDYVAVSGGYTLLGVSSVALAVGGMVLAAGVRAAGLPRSRTVSGLIAAWSIALLVVAVFPTNVPGTPVDVSAWVHRLGGGVVFVLLPVVVGLVAARAREAAHWAASAAGLWIWAGVTGAFTVVFLLNQVPGAFGAPPVIPGIGLVQRVLFAVVMVLLIVLARAVRTASESAASEVAAPGALGARTVAECGGKA